VSGAALARLRGRAATGWATPVAAWAASRALVLALGLLGSLALGIPTRGVEPQVPDALALLGGWDTTWYLDIALRGYDHDLGQVGEVYTNLAFFPLLPIIMAAGAALALNPFGVGLVAADLGFLGALLALHSLTRSRFGERRAALATWAVALAPPATTFSLAYTEGLALALAAAAALAAVRGRFALAGLAAAGAVLARPPGILVALLVGMLALWEPAARGLRVDRARLGRAALAVLPSVAALAGFLAWMWAARGSPALPFAAQGAWDRGSPVIGLFTAAPEELRAGWGHVVRGEVGAAWTAVARDVAFGALYIVLLVRLWRGQGGLRSPWVAYSAACLALPLSSGSVDSVARFGTLAFPLAWPVAEWLEAGSPRRRRWAAAAAAAGTVLLVAQLRIRAP
jgi:hypothetical protein